MGPDGRRRDRPRVSAANQACQLHFGKCKLIDGNGDFHLSRRALPTVRGIDQYQVRFRTPADHPEESERELGYPTTLATSRGPPGGLQAVVAISHCDYSRMKYVIASVS